MREEGAMNLYILLHGIVIVAHQYILELLVLIKVLTVMNLLLGGACAASLAAIRIPFVEDGVSLG